MQYPISGHPALTDDLFSRYLSFLDVSPSSVYTYTRALRRLAVFLRENGINRPTRENLLTYKQTLQQSLSPATVSSYITVARLFFQWLDAEGIYPDIGAHIKGGQVEHGHKKDALTASQLRSILQNINSEKLIGKRDRAMIALISSCGLRCIEVSEAQTSDLKPMLGRTILLLRGKGRSEKSDFVVVPEPVETLIREYLHMRGDGKALFTSISNSCHGEPLSTRSVSAIVKKRMAEAGFSSDRLTAHSLRHTAITMAAMNGATVFDLRQFARHRNIHSTMVYVHEASAFRNQCSTDIANAILTEGF